MKKFTALFLALVLLLGCATAVADNIKMDKLTFQFVPSKDADVIITGTKNLPDLIKAEMATLGYDIGEVEISVGTSYEATGEAMSAGTIDVGWLPGGTYAIYSQNGEVDVILTATRAGLSNDSENPADWNGEENATKKDGPQVTFYRALIYAAPTEYGKKLAEKWWENSDQVMSAKDAKGTPLIARRQGLLDRSKTIFALVNPDDYEMVQQ